MNGGTSYNHTDNTLDLDCLLLQLQSKVTPKWYEFGVALGIEKELLEKCMQYPPDQSIIEVCDHWLRNCGGQPTWRKVAEALKKIGYQQLASDIENVYETGIKQIVILKAYSALFYSIGELPIDIKKSDEVSVSFNDSMAEPPPPIPPRAPIA